MSPKKRSWILPLVLIALFGYMAVQIFSLNSAAPKSEYRTIIDYFRNEQVAEYELDFGTGELTILLNDEKKTTITYDVPNLSLFLQDTHELVNEYNEKHPDAPIKQYYDAAEAVPWWLDMLPLLLTVLLMGGFWYLLMKRSGGGSNPMAFAKLKPKQQDPNNRVTFEDVAVTLRTGSASFTMDASLRLRHRMSCSVIRCIPIRSRFCRQFRFRIRKLKRRRNWSSTMKVSVIIREPSRSFVSSGRIIMYL